MPIITGKTGGAKRRGIHRTILLVSLVAACLAILTIPKITGVGQEYGEPGQEYIIEAKDNFFSYLGRDWLQVPVGATVTWVNVGRNFHTVTADEGQWNGITVDAPLLSDDTFSFTFTEPGVYWYYCRPHGFPGWRGMAGVVLVGDEAQLPPKPGTEEGVGLGRETPPTEPGRTIKVPEEFSTIQAAVDSAQPGDLILIMPGVYHETVRVTTPFITIRGTDRNQVILEGNFQHANGITVLWADGVAIENMTARHYQNNAFYWVDVHGYRGSYLTAYNNGNYGLYAFNSVYGQFDHSYAGGHPDSGFYIGQCNPCHAVITDVLAENNGGGYSGTNASGDLIIANSEWRYNMAGIVPNSLDVELYPPQRDAVFVGNYVHDNNNVDAPAKPIMSPLFGMGIVVAGGVENVIQDNLVEDHQFYGIIVTPNPDRNFWMSEGNEIRQNRVRRSGRADLVLTALNGGGNCFIDNEFRISHPADLQASLNCDRGDFASAFLLLSRTLQAQRGNFPHGDWRTQPEPPPQPNMAEAETALPRPAVPKDQLEVADAFSDVIVPEPVILRDAKQLEGVDDGHMVNPRVPVGSVFGWLALVALGWILFS